MNKKCVLVTGSSIGLGSSIIKKFASNNYNIILNYNSHENEAFLLKGKELQLGFLKFLRGTKMLEKTISKYYFLLL